MQTMCGVKHIMGVHQTGRYAVCDSTFTGHTCSKCCSPSLMSAVLFSSASNNFGLTCVQTLQWQDLLQNGRISQTHRRLPALRYEICLLIAYTRTRHIAKHVSSATSMFRHCASARRAIAGKSTCTFAVRRPGGK